MPRIIHKTCKGKMARIGKAGKVIKTSKPTATSKQQGEAGKLAGGEQRSNSAGKLPGIDSKVNLGKPGRRPGIDSKSILEADSDQEFTS